MNRLSDRDLIISIAHDVVEQVAPLELDFFSALSTAYRNNPGIVRRQQAMKDDDLGFGGVEATVSVLAPTILLIVQQVLVKISNDATEKGEKGLGALFHHLRTKIFKSASASKPANKPDSPEYLSIDIWKYTYKTARECKISEKKANQIADVLVEKLRTTMEMEKK